MAFVTSETDHVFFFLSKYAELICSITVLQKFTMSSKGDFRMIVTTALPFRPCDAYQTGKLLIAAVTVIDKKRHELIKKNAARVCIIKMTAQNHCEVI